MNIGYVIREIKLAELTNSELPTEVEWLINYFKDLTYDKKEEDGTETWYDENGQCTIQVNEEKWKHTRIFYKNWDFLEEKYRFNYLETSDLVKGMLELILNRKVGTPTDILLQSEKCWS